MNKHHEVKVMSLPFETLKKRVAPFKQMVNFEADYGTDPKATPDQLGSGQLPQGDAQIGKRYTGMVEEIAQAAKRRLEMHKLS